MKSGKRCEYHFTAETLPENPFHVMENPYNAIKKGIGHPKIPENIDSMEMETIRPGQLNKESRKETSKTPEAVNSAIRKKYDKVLNKVGEK